MEKSGQADGGAWKGLAAGFVSGLVGTYLMTQAHSLLGRLTRSKELEENAQHSAQRGERRSAEGKEDATVRAASAISEGLFHHKLSQRQKKVAGPVVHYAMGAVTGAIYGAAAELAPGVTRGAGLPFGTSVWLAADEVAVPALGLSAPPREHPPSVHALALAAHLVYGVSTEMTRRLVLRALTF